MKKMLVVVGLLASIGLQGQTPTRRFEWSMDLVSDIATLQSYTYRYYLDAATVGVVMLNVTCVATPGPWTCSSAVPSSITGTHKVSITVATSATGPQSIKSNQIDLTDVILLLPPPAPPTGFKIVIK